MALEIEINLPADRVIKIKGSKVEFIKRNYRFIKRHGLNGIECLQCGWISYNPVDLKGTQCFKCKVIHKG